MAPLRDALASAPPPVGGSEPGAKLLRATKELFSDMRRGGAAFPPLGFLYTLREKFPQFAQQGAGGAYMQQDAEECWTNLLYALREKLKVAVSFGVRCTLPSRQTVPPQRHCYFGVQTLHHCSCSSAPIATISPHCSVLTGLQVAGGEDPVDRMMLAGGSSAPIATPPLLCRWLEGRIRWPG